jgi:peptidoglycan/LPS O-acetylase OafA/YrhL
VDTVVEPVRKQIKITAINTSALPIFRFFAACVVCFFHFGQKTEYYQRVPAIFKAGPEMVTFFFVLSGFILFFGYQHRELVSLRQYFMKRAIRILPLYYVAFLLAAVLRVVAGKFSFSEFFINLFCLQSWFVSPISFNFTSWFVSDLLFFYCLFPFILSFLKKRKPDPAHMIAASLLLWAVTQGILTKLLNSDFYVGYPSYSHDLLFYFPLSHFCSFFMGICGAYCIRKYDLRTRRGEVVSFLITFFLLCSVAVLIQFLPVFTRKMGFELPFYSSLYAPVFLAVILNITLSRNPLLRILSWPRFVFLGSLSYALYIIQAPMDELYQYIIPGIFIVPPGLKFLIFFILLLSVSALLISLEKSIIRRINQ